MYCGVRIFIIYILTIIFVSSFAQDIERKRPEKWKHLIPGGRFMDRFKPIPANGRLTTDTWGCDAVKPRYIDNGIEDKDYSYWGGNIIKGDDGKYHLMVCRWPESAEKGHMAWPNSEVVHAVSDDKFGPYKVHGKTIGKGHNPEAFQLSDDRYVIYVHGAYYIANNINGPWEKKKFEFNPRDRKIIEGLSNVSFTQREDGSYLAVCRGGGIWISETGVSSYNQVTNKSAYPAFDGRYEDPVIWRTNVQYHMIVNDWYGRIAYYLRSKDGVSWKVEPGEAYLPGITKYEDDTSVDWYKYERIKMLQDEYGRAIQANFAVIDSSKWEDHANDHHSSKNVSIPLVKGRLLTILGNKKITDKSKTIRVKITAEEGFDPFADVDVESLRFGATEEVNFGRGSKAIKTERSVKDMIVTFEGKGNGITDKNFAGKLIGTTNDGALLFGYARLPQIDYIEPILSAWNPEISTNGGKSIIKFEVQNFGQVTSKASKVNIELKHENDSVIIIGKVPVLKPYEKGMVIVSYNGTIKTGKKYQVKISAKDNSQQMLLLDRVIVLWWYSDMFDLY